MDCGIFVCAWVSIFCTRKLICEDAFKDSKTMRKWLANVIFQGASLKPAKYVNYNILGLSAFQKSIVP